VGTLLSDQSEQFAVDTILGGRELIVYNTTYILNKNTQLIFQGIYRTNFYEELSFYTYKNIIIDNNTILTVPVPGNPQNATVNTTGKANQTKTNTTAKNTLTNTSTKPTGGQTATTTKNENGFFRNLFNSIDSFFKSIFG
jgi:hypothetical protein